MKLLQADDMKLQSITPETMTHLQSSSSGPVTTMAEIGTLLISDSNLLMPLISNFTLVLISGLSH